MCVFILKEAYHLSVARVCLYVCIVHMITAGKCVFDYLEGMPRLDGQGVFICMYCSDILVFYNAQC